MDQLDAESRPCDQNKGHLTDLTHLPRRKEEVRTRRRAANREGSFGITVVNIRFRSAQWKRGGGRGNVL